MRFHDVTVLRDALIHQYCEEEFDRRFKARVEALRRPTRLERLMSLFSEQNSPRNGDK